MSTSINLKEIERKAFRTTYQDGLWDMYFGLVVVACPSSSTARQEATAAQHRDGSADHLCSRLAVHGR